MAEETTTTTMQEVVMAERRRRSYLAAMTSEEVAAPTAVELVGWHIYGLCTYFINTFLLPALFPLIVAYTASGSPAPAHAACASDEAQVYRRLVMGSIPLSGWKFSPLGWTAISWAAGVILTVPVVVCAAHRLDRHGGAGQLIVLSATIVAGTFFCLVTGFFRTVWLFPVYIAAVAMSSTVGSAAHTRCLALMSSASAGKRRRRCHFSRRSSAAAAALSSHATAAGCFGSLLISAFAFHMLTHSDKLTSLWVVSIFSGLLWFVAIFHVFLSGAGAGDPPSLDDDPSPLAGKWVGFLSALRCRNAACVLAAVFLSSFLSICVFTGGALHVAGDLCAKGVLLLALWIVYFAVPIVTLPLLHLTQRLVGADAVRMQVLGFFVSAAVAGAGFYYREKGWSAAVVVLAAAAQGTAAAVLHCYGQAMLVELSPEGKEGAFSGLLAISRAAGTCIGFGVAAASGAGVRSPFGGSFAAAMVAIFVLVFGNLGDSGGAGASAAAARSAANDDNEDDGGSSSPAREGNGGGVWKPSVRLPEKEVRV